MDYKMMSRCLGLCMTSIPASALDTQSDSLCMSWSACVSTAVVAVIPMMVRLCSSFCKCSILFKSFLLLKFSALFPFYFFFLVPNIISILSLKTSRQKHMNNL